jgi:Domain of unknown function (DUF2017)
VSPRFTSLGEGALSVTLSEAELDLLRSLPEELRVLYEAEDDADPVRGRLFPRAYLDPTAEDAEREWRELVHPELVRERLAAISIVVASLDGVSAEHGEVVADLSADDVAAWLGVLNDARLALGTRLGVTEETDYGELDADDLSTPGLVAYAWLTYLQGELVEALLGEG